MKRLFVLTCVACAIWTARANADINIITNGSFEQPSNCSGGGCVTPQRYFAGSSFGGWSVGGTGTDHVDVQIDSAQAYEGVQDLTLGPSGGFVSQVVNLHTGFQYTLEFHVFGQADRSGPPEHFHVNVVGEYGDTFQNSRVIANPEFTAYWLCTCSADPTHFPWSGFSTTFTADANQERLSFQRGTSDIPLFLLDAISVTEVPVPEPSSIVLLCVALFSARFCLRNKCF